MPIALVDGGFEQKIHFAVDGEARFVHHAGEHLQFALRHVAGKMALRMQHDDARLVALHHAAFGECVLKNIDGHLLVVDGNARMRKRARLHHIVHQADAQRGGHFEAGAVVGHIVNFNDASRQRHQQHGNMRLNNSHDCRS